MAFSIGSNDAANGLGTSYGTKAIPMGFIITNGAIAEFVGAMFCSDAVAVTLSENIVPGLKDDHDVLLVERMMFSVCFCTFAFVMFASWKGMPVSGTHAVIGSLLGGGMVIIGFENLNWTKMGFIVMSWFISPTFAAIIAYILMTYVASLTMQTPVFSYRTRLIFVQVMAGLCFVMMFFLADKILNPLHKGD